MVQNRWMWSHSAPRNKTVAEAVSKAGLRLLLCSLLLLPGGCESRVISQPGLQGRFVWEDSGEPIAGVSVVYEDTTGRRLISTTGEDGGFSFPPVLDKDYTGFPVQGVGLQARWTLLLSEKHNPSSSVGFVIHTDTRNATLDAGVIKISPLFRKETPSATTESGQHPDSRQGTTWNQEDCPRRS